MENNFFNELCEKHLTDVCFKRKNMMKSGLCLGFQKESRIKKAQYFFWHFHKVTQN